jgi:hypothetical protein
MASVTGSAADAWEVRLQIDGVTNTIRALRNLAPDLSRRLRASLRGAGNRIASFADASLARVSPDDAPGAYKTRMRIKHGEFQVSVYAATKNAAIFEFAGKANPGGVTPQGAAMISWLNGYASPGRFLWDAWDQMGGSVQAEMLADIQAAEAELQVRLDAGTGRGQVT